MTPTTLTLPSGTKHWLSSNGKYHREDGPAIEHFNGGKEWYINGVRHREDGPAIEWHSGSKHWYVNGIRHREDGPAIEWHTGSKHWYIDDICVKKFCEEYNIPHTYNDWPLEYKILWKLR